MIVSAVTKTVAGDTELTARQTTEPVETTLHREGLEPRRGT